MTIETTKWKLSTRTFNKLTPLYYATLKMKWQVQLLILLMNSVLVTACAQIPRSTVAESQFGTLSCAELAQQTQQGHTTKVAADQAKSDSWHAVLPFIVVARYGQASAAATEAERRMNLLTEQSLRQGCAQ